MVVSKEGAMAQCREPWLAPVAGQTAWIEVASADGWRAEGDQLQSSQRTRRCSDLVLGICVFSGEAEQAPYLCPNVAGLHGRGTLLFWGGGQQKEQVLMSRK